MTDEARQSLAKARFIRGSINDLIKLTEAERFEMLVYMLEVVMLEAVQLEANLKSGTS